MNHLKRIIRYKRRISLSRISKNFIWLKRRTNRDSQGKKHKNFLRFFAKSFLPLAYSCAIYILLLCQNVHRFDLPTGEGAPSKSEGGGGDFLCYPRGSLGRQFEGRNPQGLCTLERASALSRQASQSTHFWYKSIVCYTLHGSFADFPHPKSSRGNVKIYA